MPDIIDDGGWVVRPKTKPDAFGFRKKWHVDEALNDLRDVAERHSYKALEIFATVKGYIGVLELDLKNAQEKLNELRIQSK